MKLQLDIPADDVGELIFALYQAMNQAESDAALWFRESEVMFRDAITRLRVCHVTREQIRELRARRSINARR